MQGEATGSQLLVLQPAGVNDPTAAAVAAAVTAAAGNVSGQQERDSSDVFRALPCSF